MPYIALPVVLILALIAAALYYGLAYESRVHSIAVLPFSNQSTDPQIERLNDGLTESLIATLSIVPKLRVIAQNAVSSYKEKSPVPQKVGEDLKVANLLTGKLIYNEDQLTITAELIRTTDGSPLWSRKYEGTPSDMAAMQEQIGKEVAQKFSNGKVTKLIPANPEAFQLYLKGRYFMDEFEGEKYFNDAIKKDPKYARSYCALADFYVSLINSEILNANETFPKAKAAASKALELNPALAEAHVTMGTIRQLSWQFDEAEKEFKKAIELNPNLADAYHLYSEHLMLRGQTSEATTRMSEAHTLDPFSSTYTQHLAYYFLIQRNYERAIALCNTLLPAKWIKETLGQIYGQQGRYREAIQAFQEFGSQRHPEGAIRLGNIFTSSGYDAAMKDRAERILVFSQKWCKDHNVECYGSYAYLNSRLKNLDGAFYWLEKEYRDHSPVLPETLTKFRIDPDLKDARHDPRFASLLQRVGLPVKSDLLEYQH